ncbi:hypothetical protein GCM10009809_04070 [Isoptericola hypogeus]|uniref:Uncharacterized protein n=1 Tax=Isoptericola hypogeus TaxID=300179 RepID=A0ABN2ISI5_9MICO
MSAPVTEVTRPGPFRPVPAFYTRKQVARSTCAGERGRTGTDAHVLAAL